MAGEKGRNEEKKKKASAREKGNQRNQVSVKLSDKEQLVHETQKLPWLSLVVEWQYWQVQL